MEVLMDIKPSDIDTITTVGTLHDDEVKMLRCHGGFWIAIGKKEKKSKKPSALAAGNHPGIVIHELNKQYNNSFKESVNKSEEESLLKVDSYTDILHKKEQEEGIKLITARKNNELDFILYKNKLMIGKYETEIDGDTLLIKSWNFDKEIHGNIEIAESLSTLINTKMNEFGIKKTKIQK
jgi:hypothetical protein